MDYNIFENYIKQQKEHAVLDFNVKDKSVEYASEIKQNRKVRKLSGDEEIVRAYLLAKLVNELGYRLENIEIEKEYDIGRSKVNKPRIDVIVKDDHSNAFLYIELKLYKIRAVFILL